MGSFDLVVNRLSDVMQNGSSRDQGRIYCDRGFLQLSCEVHGNKMNPRDMSKDTEPAACAGKPQKSVQASLPQRMEKNTVFSA